MNSAKTKGQQLARQLFQDINHRIAYCNFCPDWNGTRSEPEAARHFDSAEHVANETERVHYIRRKDLAEEMERAMRLAAKSLAHGHFTLFDNDCVTCLAQLIVSKIDAPIE